MDDNERPLTETVYYVLLALVEQRHGYGIMQFVRAMTKERVVLGAGTLYGALSTLQDKGWIEPVGSGTGDRKKEYRITAEGRRVLESEMERLESLVRDGREITKGVVL